MPSTIKDWWLTDPHRKAYTEQAAVGETLPAYWAYNPAYTELQNTEIWGAAWGDIIQNGATPEAAAYRRSRKSRRSWRDIRSKGPKFYPPLAEIKPRSRDVSRSSNQRLDPRPLAASR